LSHKQVCPENITLVSYQGDEVMGTLRLGFDTGAGLLVDEIYKPEVDELRRAGRRVCEFTKLASDSKRTSKRILGGLFHIAFLFLPAAQNGIYRKNDTQRIRKPLALCPRKGLRPIRLRQGHGVPGSKPTT
jgi:hypothetical protein